MPDLVGEVTAEVASQCSGSQVLAVEEPARCEVVRLLVDLELLVGSEGGVWVVLEVTKALKEVLSGEVPRLRLGGVRSVPPFSTAAC